jgi:hypothetical protein
MRSFLILCMLLPMLGCETTETIDPKQKEQVFSKISSQEAQVRLWIEIAEPSRFDFKFDPEDYSNYQLGNKAIADELKSIIKDEKTLRKLNFILKRASVIKKSSSPTVQDLKKLLELFRDLHKEVDGL